MLLQAIVLGAEGWGNRPSNRYQSYPSGALAVLEDVDYNVIAFLCLVDWSWSMFARVRIILEFRLLLRKLAVRAERGSFRMVVVWYSTGIDGERRISRSIRRMTVLCRPGVTAQTATNWLTGWRQ